MTTGGKGDKPRPYSIPLKEFDNRWDNIFGKKDKQVTPKIEEMKKGTCGCGRSPTGNCCGWHNLTEDEFAERKELYETGKADLHGKEIK